MIWIFEILYKLINNYYIVYTFQILVLINMYLYVYLYHVNESINVFFWTDHMKFITKMGETIINKVTCPNESSQAKLLQGLPPMKKTVK